MTESTISSFVAEQRELLALELQADEEQDSENDKEERASHLLGNLEASDVTVGLYGRTVVQLTMWSEKVTTSSSTKILPAHRLRVGDEVEIRSKQKPKKGHPGGVVSEVSDTHVAVALFSKGSPTANSKPGASSNDDDDNDDEDGFGSPPLTLVPRSSAEVHRKLLQALSTLEKHGFNHPVAGTVIQAMFDPQSFPPPPVSPTTEPLNSRLDSSQNEAIAFGLQSDRPIALIHGPPGTGKVSACLACCFSMVHHPFAWFSLTRMLTFFQSCNADNHSDGTHSTGCPCPQAQSLGDGPFQCGSGQCVRTSRCYVTISDHQKESQIVSIVDHSKDTGGPIGTSRSSQI